LIIAEAGVNHNGDIGLAKKVNSRRSGMLGLTWLSSRPSTAKNLVSASAPKAEYQKKTTEGSESQLDR
jgi:N,N'-diacetyllegionaminate synthase